MSLETTRTRIDGEEFRIVASAAFLKVNKLWTEPRRRQLPVKAWSMVSVQTFPDTETLDVGVCHPHLAPTGVNLDHSLL